MNSIKKYWVIEGNHTDPNDQNTLILETKRTHGPFNSVFEADQTCMALIRKNVDNYYHKSWVIEQ
jgi:hypothetical protein